MAGRRGSLPATPQLSMTGLKAPRPSSLGRRLQHHPSTASLRITFFFLLLVSISIPIAKAGPPLLCAATSSQAAVPAQEDGACACVNGWSGPECRVSRLCLSTSSPPSLPSSPRPQKRTYGTLIVVCSQSGLSILQHAHFFLRGTF
jgi:hypothetical protein